MFSNGDNNTYTASSMVPFVNADLYEIVPVSIVAANGENAALNVAVLELHTSKDGFWFTSNDSDINYIAKTLCPGYPWYLIYNITKKD